MDRINRLYVGLAVTLVTMVAFVGPAAAQSVEDPTGGAFGGAVDQTEGFITGTAVGPIFALAGLVIVIAIGLKWLKKIRSNSS